jgi:hypothetical protein
MLKSIQYEGLGDENGEAFKENFRKQISGARTVTLLSPLRYFIGCSLFDYGV